MRGGEVGVKRWRGDERGEEDAGGEEIGKVLEECSKEMGGWWRGDEGRGRGKCLKGEEQEDDFKREGATVDVVAIEEVGVCW